MQIRVQVAGVDAVCADLRQFGEQALLELSTHIYTTAKKISSIARANAPGSLGSSMVIRRSRSNLSAFIRPGERYGAYVEYGVGELGAAHVWTALEDSSNKTTMQHKIPFRYPGLLPATRGKTRSPGLAAWARSKGLNPFAVATNMFKRRGLKGRPFVEPAGVAMGPYFVEGIDRILEKQANGFNKEGWKNVVTASWYD